MSAFNDVDRFKEYLEKAINPIGCGLDAHELQWMFRSGGQALVAENARLRAALDLIWHIAPLPTQSETQRIERIFEIARKALFPDVNQQSTAAKS